MSKFLGDAASQTFYGSQGSPMGGDDIHTALPRNKFNYEVEINFVDSTPSLSLKTVANITLPSVTFKSMPVNQYNKKRIVHTGYELPDVSMTIYDTRDGKVDNFLSDYAAHYFGGMYNNSSSDMSSADIISDAFNGGGSSGKGFILQEEKYYIRNIVIIRNGDSQSDERKVVLENPSLTTIDPDTLDYSDSGVMQYKLNFAYEGFHDGEPASTGGNLTGVSGFGGGDLAGAPVSEVVDQVARAATSGLQQQVNDAVDNLPSGLPVTGVLSGIQEQISPRKISIGQVSDAISRYQSR